jgi:hypothetical protein
LKRGTDDRRKIWSNFGISRAPAPKTLSAVRRPFREKCGLVTNVAQGWTISVLLTNLDPRKDIYFLTWVKGRIPIGSRRCQITRGIFDIDASSVYRQWTGHMAMNSLRCKLVPAELTHGLGERRITVDWESMDALKEEHTLDFQRVIARDEPWLHV